MPSENANAVSRRRGLLVLVHPVAAMALALWLVNDHVLKATYGSWWTGKLSDVVGLVFFPVLVAAGIERFVDRPLPVALVFTTLLYGSINLFASADLATEWGLSLVVDSRLTSDPTDLLALPALAGAWWVWNRPVHSWTRLRRSWGRMVFVVGVGATLATGQAMSESNVVAGTVVLTEEQPSVSIPFTLSVDGEAASIEDYGFEYVPTVLARSFAPAGVVPTQERNFVKATAHYSADGSSELVLSLEDLALAPVEAQWTFKVELWDKGDPVLTMTLPPDEFGPEPLASVSPDDVPFEDARAWEWVVTAPTDSEVSLSMPRQGFSKGLVVGTVDGPIELEEGFLTPVPIPSSCAADPCTYSIWITTTRRDVGFDLDLYGPPEVSVAPALQHLMVLTTRKFFTETVASEKPIEVVFTGDLELPEPVDPIDELTRILRVRAWATLQQTDDDELSAQGWIRIGSESDYSAVPIPQCCEPVSVGIRLHSRQDRDRFDLAETKAEITVELWSLQAFDSADITLTLDE